MAVRGREPDDDLDDFDDAAEEESDQAYCPDCGAQIWDQSDVCPKCFAFLGGDTSRHPPGRGLRSVALRRLVVALILIGMFAGLALAILTRRW